MSGEPIDRTDLSKLLWRAAVAVEQGDPDAAAELLEMAARRLRKKGGEEAKPASAGDAGKHAIP